MSSTTDHDQDSTSPGRTESALRAAFERLKHGEPQRLKKGTPVTQNNVAREAGYQDPSILRKQRFPSLVAEIQRWVEAHGAEPPPSPRQTLLRQRRRNRSLREQIADLTAQRDQAMSLLVAADAEILRLAAKIADLESTQARSPGEKVTA
jgi:hypothetical protein